jgi:hypothetical protein
VKLGEAEALKRVEQLGVANGTKSTVAEAEGFEARVVAATRYGSQRTIDDNVISALDGVVSEGELKLWEEAIGRAGTLVARRAWGIFWSEGNRVKWIDYLRRKHQLAEDQAELILGRVCYLPASKRKPEDTYWTLAARNMVHTEFPNHQENVRRMAEADGFRLVRFEESITGEFSPEVLQRLNEMADFRQGYELNVELNQILCEAGIEGDFGSGGHTPDQWSEFGSVQKTLGEFKAAYDGFRDEMLRLFQESER